MLSILILAGFTVTCLAISFVFDKKKTLTAIKKGGLMLLNLLFPFITILILVSAVLYFTPNELIVKWLGQDAGAVGMLIAGVVGSISLIPGFIAYPLGGILVKSGVGYPVIAIFITTLMMVGVITLPIEKKFFGMKVALTRNIFSFIGSIIVGLAIGALWGVL